MDERAKYLARRVAETTQELDINRRDTIDDYVAARVACGNAGYSVFEDDPGPIATGARYARLLAARKG